MKATDAQITEPIATTDPLAILAESGVDVFDVTDDIREIFAELSVEEARVLADVNRRLDSVKHFPTREFGGINH